ncbi:MAG TPA: hypothetical protein VLW51_10110 [Solirubrobacteraceae bacterium]|nr:hypothetical protein [Solirubrobacteraceae bacterium]
MAALLVASSVALAVAGCGGGAAQPPAHASRTQPLETIFEAQTELFAKPGPTLDVLKRLGVDDVKVFMQWGPMTPDSTAHTRPAGFDAAEPSAYAAAAWAPYDAIIRAAAARGIGVDLALEAPAPLWAVGPGVPPGTAPGFVGAWEPSAKEYGLFVHAVATRYSGHYTPPGGTAPLPPVRFWSIWNEPNYGQQLAPQAVDDSTVEVSPLLYRELLDAAWTALAQTGHGADKILIGEMAPRGQTTGDQPGNFSGMVPLRFIRALYCVDSSLHPLQGTAATLRGCPATASGSKAFPSEHPALFHASGFAVHPYPQGQVTPNVATKNEPDYADLPKLPSLEATLDGAVAAYRISIRFPIYDTEFGYQTNPPEKIARAINPTLAAYYMNWAEYISWSDPRVASWDQYLLTDPPPQSKSNFDTGLEFASGAAKDPMYDAFRMPLYLPHATGKRGQPLEVWGGVRPAHFAKGSQVASIQFKPSSGGAFKTIQRVTISDAYGYFTASVRFPSSGSVRIAWSEPGSGEVHSRIAPVTIG